MAYLPSRPGDLSRPRDLGLLVPQADNLVTDVMAGRLDRRQVFKRATMLGLGAPAIAALLAAGPRGFLNSASAQGGSLTIASNASDEAPRQRLADMVEAFQSSTGVDVTVDTTNHEDFKVQIRTFLASDNTPDVLTWFAGNRMRYFVDLGLVEPVTDLWTSAGWETNFPEGIKAVSKGADSEYYFVPSTYYSWEIWYRKSLFEQAGIEAAPTTWDELLTASDKLLAVDIKPFTLGSSQPWTTAAWFDYLNMRINGPEFHIELMDGKQSYTSPEVKEVFNRWNELLGKNAYIDNPESYLWQDALNFMVQGDAGMYLMGNFLLDSYPEEDQDDLDFFRFPMISEGVLVGEDAPTDGYFIAAGAENVDTAKAFLQFISEPDIAGPNALAANAISVNSQVPIESYNPVIQKSVKLLQESDYLAQFYDRDTIEEMATQGMAAFQGFMLEPTDIDSLLETLDEDRKRIFETT